MIKHHNESNSRKKGFILGESHHALHHGEESTVATPHAQSAESRLGSPSPLMDPSQGDGAAHMGRSSVNVTAHGRV